MQPDGHRSDEFFEGIGDIPKGDRSYTDESDSAGETDYAINATDEVEDDDERYEDEICEEKWDEEIRDTDDCGEAFNRGADKYMKEHSGWPNHSHEYKHSEYSCKETIDPALIKRAAKQLKKVFDKDNTPEPVGEEREFEVEFSYAYDNVQGNRHSVTRTELTRLTEDEPIPLNDAQNEIHDRVMNKYPNCIVKSIRPMREVWE